MNVTNLVKASAQIIQVTELSKGDVYKRLQDDTYSGTSIKYGVVIDVLYNGEDAALQAIEYDKSYRDIKVEMKTFSAKDDMKIFACTPQEVREYFGDIVADVEREIDDKAKSLREAEEKLSRVKQIVSGELEKKLTAPRTAVIAEASA